MGFGKILGNSGIGAAVGGAIGGPFGSMLGGGYGAMRGAGMTGTPALNLPALPQYQKSQYEDIMNKFATSQGPSQQANYLTSQANNMAGQQIGQMRSQAQGMANQGMSQLAMRGGLQSGSRERLMKNASNQGMLGAQSVYGNLANQKLGILANDESNKMNMLGGLQNMYDTRYANQLQAEAGRQGAMSQYATATRPGMSNLFGIGNAINGLFG